MLYMVQVRVNELSRPTFTMSDVACVSIYWIFIYYCEPGLLLLVLLDTTTGAVAVDAYCPVATDIGCVHTHTGTEQHV